ncbi:cyclic pyranopterin monophosphate synthase MoaC [Fulvivirga sp. RKSG066]|uniref:cyclic pyranopterin monophosphate synthase MoaC n=1 Tax=Fulvivirga aurantia TaxID=2529383 RepID=UPI0012BD4358|nr:cyclic pyranopterin monophosphate synthase MoaC [Fulvivirga aurantia]MTI22318.1 cyclic pyranopterin monophosphate synthase MoaC [Fulvivirga aurantia]
MSKLTHIGADGNPKMVDISDKEITERRAVAESRVSVTQEIMDQLTGNELVTKKGPVFQTSIIAGVMGAKKTADLIPFCHQLPLSNCKIDITTKGNDIIITCEAKVTGKTGVEIEALTGASVAALTVYDMCKALSHDIIIKETRLISKSGGKSDFNRNA